MKSFTLTPISKLKLDKVLAYFISVDMMPYNLVDKEGFKLFVNALNPSYRLPSRTTLSNRKIPDLFKETKMKEESILSSTTFLCLTTDCWTSVAQKPFIALTGHFMDKSMNLGKKL